MNIEEQKAIEMLEYIKNKNSLMGFSIAETETTPNYRGKLAITLLNLIEKQQSELEKKDTELKESQKETMQIYSDYQDIGKIAFDLDEKVQKLIEKLEEEIEKDNKELNKSDVLNYRNMVLATRILAKQEILSILKGEKE